MDYFKRLLKLVFGLFLFAIGTVFTIQTNLGFGPWQVFHKGLSLVLGTTIGQASIGVGLIIIVLNAVFKENMGIGTVLDMLLVGLFMDFILWLDIVPMIEGLWGIAFIIVGLLIIAVASYLYMSAGFGAGPRDGLMVILTKKTKLPIGICRSGIEFLAVVFGWLMGGPVGIGTIVAVLAVGPCIQVVFSLVKFDINVIKHEYLGETAALLKAKVKA